MKFLKRKKEPVKKNFFIAERIEHLDDDRFGNFGKSYSYFPYKEERRYVDDEGRVHEETYFFTFDTFEDALKPIVEVSRNTCGKLAIVNPEELNQQK